MIVGVLHARNMAVKSAIVVETCLDLFSASMLEVGAAFFLIKATIPTIKLTKTIIDGTANSVSKVI